MACNRKQSQCDCGKQQDDKQTDNLSAVLYGAKDLRLEQRPVPEPGFNQVLIKIQRVGICRSDVQYFLHGNMGNHVVNQPMVIGHEASGIVVAVGQGVTNLCVGDRVAIEPGVPCRTCKFCKKGKYNLCPDMVFCATPPVDGTLARFYVHAADFCYKLPDHVSLDEGALVEPLSVGVHACKRGGVTAGSMVLILGAGPVGLVTLAAAIAMGASKVYVTDLLECRLLAAKPLGARKVIKINKQFTDEESIECVLGHMDDKFPDVVIDCTGHQQTINMAIALAKSGGVIVVAGMAEPCSMELPLFDALSREVDIRGVFRYANDYPDALSLMASGQVNLKCLVSHSYNMEDTLEAFETLEAKCGNPIKVMIHVGDDV